MPPIIEKWEAALGVSVARVFIQHMKTKWGSANPERRTIRLNSELAKKSPEYLDYIVLHEMAHFISSKHDARFRAVLQQCMPNWQSIGRDLNTGPLRMEWQPTEKRRPLKRSRSARK